MDKIPYDETLGETSQQESAPRPQETEQARAKRTRIRQACERCKSRKTKVYQLLSARVTSTNSQCNNQRPCAACSAAGVACTDWRPGEEPITVSTTTQALENANYDFNQQQPVSLNELEPYIDPTLSRQMQDQLRSYHEDLRPRNAQENAAGMLWPRAPAPDRQQRLPYPHDLLFRNERGLFENASGSGGLSHSAYLAKIHNQEVLGELASWPNKANERLAVTGPSTIYDQIESQVGWKIVSPLLGYQLGDSC